VEKGRSFGHNCECQSRVKTRKQTAFSLSECNQESFEFAAHFSRRVVAEFSADRLTTDGGSLLLRQVDRRIRLLHRFAACFVDGRDPSRIEHAVAQIVAQRVYGLALAGKSTLNRL
jgi:hypothetical protein